MVPLIKNSAVIIGSGRIARWLVNALGDTVCTVIPLESLITELDSLYSGGSGLAILVEDEWTGNMNPMVERLRLNGTTLLVVSGRMNRVFVGPLEFPEAVGCSTCVNIRWKQSRRLSPLFSSMGDIFAQGSQIRLPLTLNDADMSLVAGFVEEQVRRVRKGQLTDIEGKVGIMRAGASGVEVTSLIPSDDCPRCRGIVSTFSHASELSFRSQSLSVPAALRVKDIDLNLLRDMFVNREIGLISEVDVHQLTDKQIGAHARITLPNQKTVSGFGIALTTEEAEKTAILEVLERTCGRYPSNLTQNFVGTYDQLSQIALHPKLFGLHDDAVYHRANSRYQQFKEEEPYHWVQGLSFQNKGNVLVPERLAFHQMNRAGESKFVQQTSNGCAIGGAFEEAVLYGLLEVFERDAFLNTWYGRLPAPEIDIADVLNEEVLPWVEYLREDGYDVRLFNISHDFMIPCVMAVAVNRRNNFPKVVCGAAAHLLPNIAISKAIRELASQVFTLNAATAEKIASARGKRLTPSKIETISDHRLVGALPEAHAHWSFLLDGPRRFHEPWETWHHAREGYKLSSNDMTIILNAVLDDMFHHGFDVIVVPQTRTEIASAGLHATRVLVPGMTPMTFGYDYRRIQGLERVLQLPHELGYSARPLQIEELNTDPHPFG